MRKVCIWLFGELPNCIQSSSAILRSHQQCVNVPVSLHPSLCLIVHLFAYRHLVVWSSISSGFNLHFLLINDVGYLSRIIGHLISFWEMFIKILCQLLFGLFVFLFRVISVLYIFWYNLIRYMIYQYFFSFCRLSFHFLANILWNTKVLILTTSCYISIFFVCSVVLLLSYLGNQWLIQSHTGLLQRFYNCNSYI